MTIKNEYKIVRIDILPFGLVGAYLISNDYGCILVDTGLPNSLLKIQKALDKNGFSFKDIKLIIIAHAHIDHIGEAFNIRELSGAPILAHEGDIDFFTKKQQISFKYTGLFGYLFLKTPLMFEPHIPFSPDIILRENEIFKLNPFGFDGIVEHASGHTSGSIMVSLADSRAIVGDLISSGILLGGIIMTKHPKRPPFEDNPKMVAKALYHLIADNKIEKFYM